MSGTKTLAELRDAVRKSVAATLPQVQVGVEHENGRLVRVLVYDAPRTPPRIFTDQPRPRLEENADRVDGHVHRLICRLRNELSDRCGALETEKRDLEVENSQLRRQVERLERRLKGGVR